MFVNASILTKTRFLGLSVGMQTVGTCKCCKYGVQSATIYGVQSATIWCPISYHMYSLVRYTQHTPTVNFHLLDYGEEYVLTFPHIYVRSVALYHLQFTFPLASLSPPQVCSDHSLVGDGGCMLHHMCPEWMYR